LAAAPRPAPFDFGLESEAQKCPDHHDDSEQPDALKRQGRGDSADYVGSDQEFEAKKDSAAKVRPILFVSAAPVASAAASFANEPGCGESHSNEDYRDTRELQHLGKLLDVPVNLLHSLTMAPLAACSSNLLRRRFRTYPSWANLAPMFDLPNSADVVVRAVALSVTALLWAVVLVRFIGLRSFSKMSAFDFVGTIAMGSLLAAAATADAWARFAQPMLAMLALLLMQATLAWLRSRSARVRRLLGNTPVILMRDGQFCPAALSQTRVAREDVLEKIRGANVHDLGDVRAVVLETTGDISVLHGSEIHEDILSGVRESPRGRQDLL